MERSINTVLAYLAFEYERIQEERTTEATATTEPVDFSTNVSNQNSYWSQNIYTDVLEKVNNKLDWYYKQYKTIIDQF